MNKKCLGGRFTYKYMCRMLMPDFFFQNGGRNYANFKKIVLFKIIRISILYPHVFEISKSVGKQRSYRR